MSDITTMQNATNQAADLAPVPAFDAKGYAAAVFEPFKRQIAKAKREAGKAEAYDITTGAGMGRAKELRAMFRDIRTGVENARKDRKAPIIEAGKLLDARAAEIKADVEQFEDKYDREIKAEEARKEAEKQRKLELERERVEAIEKRIAHIRNAPGRVASADSVTINQEINQWTILRLDPADYQEYLEDALTAVNTTLEQLESLLASAQEREAEARRVAAEREELARLKAEQAERERVAAAEAAERARVAHAERDKAEAERLAAAAREAEQRRQMEAMQAAQAKQQQIMQDIQAIQQRGQIDGDARTLLNALNEIQALELDMDYYGGMHSMATMAQSMAASSIGHKYGIRLMAEIPAAHDEALAEKAQREMVEVPLVVEGQPVVMGVDLAAPDADLTAEWIADVPTVPTVLRPTDEEIIDHLAQYYGETLATVRGWLKGMNL